MARGKNAAGSPPPERLPPETAGPGYAAGPRTPSPQSLPQEQHPEANATPYGLASYVFTQDLARALRVADAIDAGMTGINRGLVSNPAAPFGGTKQSGLGREGGTEGLEAYQETKYTGIQLCPQPPEPIRKSKPWTNTSSGSAS